MKQARNPLAEYALLLMLALIWGSSFILMKRGLVTYNPVEVAALRLFFAGTVLLPVFIAYYRSIPKQAFGAFFLSGLLGNGLPAFMFAYAQTRLSSSLAGALNALTPLFTLLIGIIIFKLRLNLLQTIAVFIGLGGALLLILFRPGVKVEGDLFYVFIVIMATLFYGINVNIIKQRLAAYRPMVVAAFPVIFMAFPSMLILIGNGFVSKHDFSGVALESLLYIAILGIMGTALSLVAFNNLIQRSNAVFASSVTYLMPVVALLWGFWDNEEINRYQIFGMVLILVGVILVNRFSNRAVAPEKESDQL